MKLIMENWREYLDDSSPLNVVYFGGFKPPHKGHAAIVEEYLSMPDVKRVFIMFGWSPRKSDDGTVILDDRHARRAWELIVPTLSDPSRVIIAPVTKGNTMVRAAEMAWDNKLSGERITAGFGAKEPYYGETFMKIIDSLAASKGPPAARPVMVSTNINIPSISASKIRNAAAVRDMETLSAAIPDEVSVEDYLNVLLEDP